MRLQVRLLLKRAQLLNFIWHLYKRKGKNGAGQCAVFYVLPAYMDTEFLVEFKYPIVVRIVNLVYAIYCLVVCLETLCLYKM